MKRFSSAQLIETATFVVAFAIPPAIIEWQTPLPWWAILSVRLFNVVLNAWTLLYCEAFGAWLTTQFPTFSRLLHLSPRGCKRASELGAVLIMQLPISFLFLLTLNQWITAKKQSLAAPTAITVALCLVMWSFEEWGRPFLERRVPWLARMARSPVGAATDAARGALRTVVVNGRRIDTLRRRIMKGGSRSR